MISMMHKILIICLFALLFCGCFQPKPPPTIIPGIPANFTTSYGPIPPTTVDIRLMTERYAWAHWNSTQRCYWEIHPGNNLTINSVSYKVMDSGGTYIYGDNTTGWISTSPNASDFLLYNSSSFTLSPSKNYTCMIRVVQNLPVGTNETTQNDTFTGIGYAIPGCEGQADCNITSPVTMAIGQNNATHRNVYVTGTTLALNDNNTVLNISQSFVNTGVVSFSSRNLTINSYLFNNTGTIDGTGASGADGWCSCSNRFYAGAVGGVGGTLKLFISAYSNNGSINLYGGAGGASCVICGIYPSTCTGAVTGGFGGAGGLLNISGIPLSSITLGTVDLHGGNGADGKTTGPSSCTYDTKADGGAGGNAGRLNISTFDFISSSAINANGGNGGTGVGNSFYTPCPNGGNGGTGFNGSAINIFRNMTVTAIMNTSGGVGGAKIGTGTGCSAGVNGLNGAWNVTYCANGTSNNWSKLTPASNNTTGSCYALPPTPVLTSPTNTSNYTILVQNLSVNYTASLYSGFEVWLSQNNGTTWTRYAPAENNLSLTTYTANNYSIWTHRLLNSSTNLVRVRSYNATTRLFSNYSVNSTFNTTYIWSNLTRSSIPFGTVTITSILFQCNYSNSTNAPIQAATAYLYLDGSLVNVMTYNVTSGLYSYMYVNTTWVPGPHNWTCNVSKADYIASDAIDAVTGNLSVNITLAGFGIYVAGNNPRISFTCPFPTIDNLIPAGQKAYIGILRIGNNNATSLKNYTLFLNNTLPTGFTVWARCDKFSLYDSSSNWIPLSTTSGYQCLNNVNSTNLSAYIWMKARCVSVAPGTYIPFDYIINEQ